MDKWTWRQHVACYIHQLAFVFARPEHQCIVIRDRDGEEVFSVSFEGGFVASGPSDGYTASSREYADDDDMVGTEVAW